MMRIITNDYDAQSPHPGEFIYETYLEPLRISIRGAAKKPTASLSTFDRLINGKSNIFSILAMKLNQGFGRTPTTQ
ncbi:MAG: hypothetical protein JJT82_01555 [Legionellaceae bacterium]|nr:hypothetical protein [Legionellaceae bacterium]